uniref:cAMP responsive element modulator n=1 Tax=Paramormyrops kingsleyae TaxID=1676925 RepID=A0A3B3SJ53_9TELE
MCVLCALSRRVAMETMVASQQDASVNDSLSDGEVIRIKNESGSSSLAQTSVGGEGGTGAPSAVTVVQLSGGQTLHVQGVIQAPQASVIQSPHIQNMQVVAVAASEDGETAEVARDTQKRREILTRRPSYRRIFNDLSSDASAVPKIEENPEEDRASPSDPQVSAAASIYQTSSGQYTATGDMPAYQIRTPVSSLAQNVVMAASPGALHSPQPQHTEEATRKREVRLMKNREAARECRRKKKEYVKCLENRVAVLENQNKTLIEELKALKDIYCHKAE